MDDDFSVEELAAKAVFGHINEVLDRLFHHIELLGPKNRARLLAHIEDRVREETDRLEGESDGMD